MAYLDDESGQYEVFVTPFPNVGWRTMEDFSGGGFGPVWGPDSRELFYQTQALGSSTIRIMVAVNETEPTFIPGSPVPLFEGPYRSVAFLSPRVFDVFPDGQRFLMIKEATAAEVADANIIIVFENWVEELTRLAPRDR